MEFPTDALLLKSDLLLLELKPHRDARFVKLAREDKPVKPDFS